MYKDEEVSMPVQNQTEELPMEEVEVQHCCPSAFSSWCPRPKHDSLYKGLGMLVVQSQANEKSLFQPNLSCTSASSNEKGGPALSLLSPQCP